MLPGGGHSKVRTRCRLEQSRRAVIWRTQERSDRSGQRPASASGGAQGSEMAKAHPGPPVTLQEVADAHSASLGRSVGAPSRESATWLAILDKMPVGVIVFDIAAARVILRNSISREILGRLAEHSPQSDQELSLSGAAHAGGRPYEKAEYPLARAATSGEMVDRELLFYRTPDDHSVVLEVSASRIVAHDERQLAVCTFQDVTGEHERARALQDAAERVDLALHAGAIVGTWIYDVPADLMTADERFALSLGLDPERCRRGMPAAEAYSAVHPEDLASVQTAVSEALAQGGAYRCQFRVRGPDGDYRWVEASGLVELDAQGRARRFPGVLLDITAWKHAEEARNLLMREVDHRARNALAMVQSVVRLTTNADPVAYRKEVLGRIDAMARAQGSLSRANWEGASLAQVVREELSALAPADRFHLAGPDVTLKAWQVQPVQMIIHELVTNALKYGAFSSPGGRVDVNWRFQEGSGLQMVWREHGGPVASPPQKTGFGTRLIHGLAKQLGGQVEMDWRPPGLIATLTWRLEHRRSGRADGAGASQA